MLCSEIDVAGGQGRIRVWFSREFDEVVQGSNRFDVVSLTRKGEPLLLIRRIVEMSQVREGELAAATQSDGVKPEGRGTDGEADEFDVDLVTV